VVLMAADPLDEILRLVAEGRLTADEAAPILAALDERPSDAGTGAGSGPTPDDPARRGQGETAGAAQGGAPRTLRIEITDGGRPVVNLRLPIAVGKLALDRIPGLPAEHVARIREALRNGYRGSVLEVDDDGDGVRIVLE
jgi:SHOCT-like domain